MKKIIRILAYLLITLVPVGVLLRFNISPGISVVPQDIVVGVMFVLIVLNIVFHKKKLSKTKNIVFVFLAFIGVGIISLLINMQTYKAFSLSATMLYVARYIAYSSLLLVGGIIPGSFLPFKKWFIGSGAIIVLIGFLQFFFYNNLRNLYYLGWDDHLYRLFSVFLDPNFAGAFYVIFIFILLSLIQRKASLTNKTYIVIIYCLILLSVLSVYLTYSRTAFIMLFAGITIFLLLRRRVRELALLLAILIGGFVFFSNSKVEGLNPFRLASTANRLNAAKDAMSIFQKNPLIGVGFNSYRYAQIHYGYRDVIGGKISNADAGTDNSYLFILATTGIAGAFMFVFYYLLVIKTLLKMKQELVRDAWIGMFVAFFVGGFFVNLLFYTPILLVINLFTGFLLQKKTRD